MIPLFWLLPGLALPTVSGWCLLGCLEKDHRVLHPLERWVLGFALGLLSSTFLTFLGAVFLGIPLTLPGFLTVQIAALLLTGGWWFCTARSVPGDHAPRPSPRPLVPSTTMNIALVVLALWTLAKMGAAAFDVITTPAFFNDTITNWNARAKVYVALEEFSLSLPSQNPGDFSSGISSYPPSVPLVKAWLASLAGAWHEGLVNAIHFVWYLALLILVFLTLRRTSSWLIAVFGTYVLSSLPLMLTHSMVAYADIFMALHLFIPSILLFHALHQEERGTALSFLKLSVFAIGLVPFTKNEGLLLYFPLLVLFSAVTHGLLLKRAVLSTRDMRRSLLWTASFVLLILIPWLVFKWTHGLDFGNAKPLGGFSVSWQSGVLQSVAVSLFFHGSWLLLFPLLLFLLVTQWRVAFLSRTAFLTILLLVLFCGQLSLYLFTGLSVEAMKQTGYGRGLIHLVPIAVVLISLLLDKAESPTP